MDKMTGFTFVMLACLFVLFGWVQYSVVRRAWRKRRAVFRGGAILRYGGSAILFGFACFCFICGLNAIKDGSIFVVLHGRLSNSSVAFTIHRADNPNSFWEAVCVYIYMALTFYFLSFAEIITSIRESSRVPHKVSKAD
jgi:hypothetical protein